MSVEVMTIERELPYTDGAMVSAGSIVTKVCEVTGYSERRHAKQMLAVSSLAIGITLAALQENGQLPSDFDEKRFKDAFETIVGTIRTED